MEANSLGSWPNSKKYGGKNANEACQLNLYPMANHGNCKSNIESGLSKGHIFIIFVSPFAPFIRPTQLPQDDLMK